MKDSHGVTADKLREAGQDVRRQISPPNRLQVLDDIYFVRQMEERFLNGEIGKSFPTYSENLKLITSRREHIGPSDPNPSSRRSLPRRRAIFSCPRRTRPVFRRRGL